MREKQTRKQETEISDSSKSEIFHIYIYISVSRIMFYNIIPVNQNTNFSTSSPLFFHLQSAVKFHNFAILGRRERGESVESNLRSERYEEIRKILIKIAQGFNQTKHVF